jgi:hypothetical protein
MDPSAAAPSTAARDAVVAWVLRVALVSVSVAALRTSVLSLAEVRRHAAMEFDLFGSLTSAESALAHVLAVLAGLAFTLACRLPLRAGIRWPPIVMALLPAALVSHLVLLAARVGEDSVFEGALIRSYFFDDDPARWAFACLVGVAIGCGLGRSGESP